MKKALMLLTGLFLYNCLFSQCKNLNYYSSTRVEYTMNDTLSFTALNKCKKPQSAEFSIELFDFSGEWQEFDGDIFAEGKGMKIITLPSMKKMNLVFNTKGIDPIFFKDCKKIRFRIVSNLFSPDKIQIVQTKVVKEFFVNFDR